MYEEKKKILVIDDEPDLVEMIKYQFEARGFEVETASNGIEGLKKKDSFDPHLIILDLNMPQMGGVEFYQKICDEQGRPSHPVLVLTARANMEQMFKEFDVDGFMSKPFDVTELIREVEIIVQKKDRLHDRDLSVEKVETIFIVEDEPEEFSALAVKLLGAGYRVDSAQSGSSALVKMMASPPDLALVKLNLVDLPGDLVVMRLKKFSKTSEVRCVLFMKEGFDVQDAILKNLKEKTGVLDCIQYSTNEELLDAVDKILQGRLK